ncbi:hypothetical protein J4732_11605 [Serratia marcescens]|uniref:Uncharacterized protein n=1 Tax=Serratia marcescens TaxID=615 RepID=A0A939NPY0_SERMA|nr:hypothetical protein [Serratia marcescens]
MRQLNDSIGVGSVAHYEQGNALLITGRASVVTACSSSSGRWIRRWQSGRNSRAEACGGAEIARMVNELFREGAAHGRRDRCGWWRMSGPTA